MFGSLLPALRPGARFERADFARTAEEPEETPDPTPTRTPSQNPLILAPRDGAAWFMHQALAIDSVNSFQLLGIHWDLVSVGHWAQAVAAARVTHTTRISAWLRTGSS